MGLVIFSESARDSLAISLSNFAPMPGARVCGGNVRQSDEAKASSSAVYCGTPVSANEACSSASSVKFGSVYAVPSMNTRS